MSRRIWMARPVRWMARLMRDRQAVHDRQPMRDRQPVHDRQPMRRSATGDRAAHATGTQLPPNIASLPQRGRELYHNGKEAIINDLNSPQLLSVLWAVIKDTELSAADKIRLTGVFDAVLGLDIVATVRQRIEGARQPAGLSDAEIDALVQQRIRARNNKEWQVADDIRTRLHDRGITIVDKRDRSRMVQIVAWLYGDA